MNVLSFKRTLRVVVADRDFMSSDMLAEVVRHDPRFTAAAVRREDLIRHVCTNDIDLVVIADSESNAGGTRELADCIQKKRTDTPIVIVVLLDEASPEGVLDAFRSGARGVVARQHSTADFLECIGAVARGLIWAGRHESDILLSALKTLPTRRTTVDSDFETLTPREIAVVKCAARGKTNKEIASELRLSEHTVKNYLWRASEKLKVSSRVELFFYLTSRGLSLEDESVVPNTLKADAAKPIDRASAGSKLMQVEEDNETYSRSFSNSSAR